MADRIAQGDKTMSDAHGKFWIRSASRKQAGKGGRHSPTVTPPGDPRRGRRQPARRRRQRRDGRLGVGGCIEGAVVQEALAAIKDGKPRLLDFGVTDEQAWDVGLACAARSRCSSRR